MNDIVKQHIRKANDETSNDKYDMYNDMYNMNDKVDKEWFQIQIKSLEEKLDRRNDKLRR